MNKNKTTKNVVLFFIVFMKKFCKLICNNRNKIRFIYEDVIIVEIFLNLLYNIFMCNEKIMIELYNITVRDGKLSNCDGNAFKEFENFSGNSGVSELLLNLFERVSVEFNKKLKGNKFDLVAGIFDEIPEALSCVSDLKSFNKDEPDFEKITINAGYNIDKVISLCYLKAPPDGVSSNSCVYMVVYCRL